MPDKIKLIVFDLDGTLVDAYQAVAASLNHALTSFGYPALDDLTIKRSVGWGDKNLVSKFVSGQDIDRVLSVYRLHHRSALKSGTKFLPGAKQLLGQLKNEGYQLGIASNRPSRFTHIILKHLGVQSDFAAVVCADQVAAPKPAADCLEKILKTCGVHPGDALYVGDMTIDIETGKNAGVRTVGVITGSSTEEEIKQLKPAWIIHHISELQNVLHALENK